MSWFERTLKLVGMGLLACTSMACVEQEASLGLNGVAAFEGTATTVELTCGGGDGGGGGDGEMMASGSAVTVPSRTCERQVGGGGGVDNFLTRAAINIPQFREAGQPGEGKGLTTVEEFCTAKEMSMLPQAIEKEFFYRSFDQWVSVVNRLQESTSVEAGGQGGGQGGFEGLQLDMNDIQITRFEVTFPGVAQSGDGGLGLDRELRLAAVVESSGGSAILQMSFFDQSDADALAAVHERLVVERNSGISEYNDEAKRTPVTIIADVAVIGETLGEQEVESNHLEFPIALCNDLDGCGTTTPRCNFKTEAGGGG